jgi:hypothetical protein
MGLRMMVKVLHMVFLQSFMGNDNSVKKYLVVSCGSVFSMHTIVCSPFFTWENTHKLMGFVVLFGGGGGTRFLPPHIKFLEKPKFENKDR